MAYLSSTQKNALMNALLRGVPFVPPTMLYVALYLTDPGDGDAGIEVSGAAYTRKVVAFNNPINGVCTNTAEVVFPQATGVWGTLAFCGIRDALTGGNLLFHGPLSASQYIQTGDIFRFKAGSISCSIS